MTNKDYKSWEVFREVFGPKKDYISGEFSIYEELSDLYRSRNILTVMKSRKLRGNL
jgi:hypothetical protein